MSPCAGSRTSRAINAVDAGISDLSIPTALPRRLHAAVIAYPRLVRRGCQDRGGRRRRRRLPKVPKQRRRVIRDHIVDSSRWRHGGAIVSYFLESLGISGICKELQRL
jgi:hypothetical protein